MAVGVGDGVESLCELILSFGRNAGLVLQDHDVRGVESLADSSKVFFGEVLDVHTIDGNTEIDSGFREGCWERGDLEGLDSHCCELFV